MTNTDGIDNVVIYWDDDDGEYNAGQLLTGRIEVNRLIVGENSMAIQISHFRCFLNSFQGFTFQSRIVVLLSINYAFFRSLLTKQLHSKESGSRYVFSRGFLTDKGLSIYNISL